MFWYFNPFVKPLVGKHCNVRHIHCCSDLLEQTVKHRYHFPITYKVLSQDPKSIIIKKEEKEKEKEKENEKNNIDKNLIVSDYYLQINLNSNIFYFRMFVTIRRYLITSIIKDFCSNELHSDIGNVITSYLLFKNYNQISEYCMQNLQRSRNIKHNNNSYNFYCKSNQDSSAIGQYFQRMKGQIVKDSNNFESKFTKAIVRKGNDNENNRGSTGDNRKNSNGGKGKDFKINCEHFVFLNDKKMALLRSKIGKKEMHYCDPFMFLCDINDFHVYFGSKDKYFVYSDHLRVEIPYLKCKQWIEQINNLLDAF